MNSRSTETSFWTQTFADRVLELDQTRDSTPFVPGSIDNRLTGQQHDFVVACRYDDIIAISKRPEDF